MHDLRSELSRAAGHDVSRETEDRLITHLELLKKWNSTINLVSSSTLTDGWKRHVVDSAQLFASVGTRRGRWIDLGSGGGFPGLVCAAIAKELAPMLDFSLIESDRRKCAFLATASREMGLKTTVVSKRIEEIAPLRAAVVSARALSSLSNLLNYSERHLDPGGVCAFLKGERFQDEIAQARKQWRFKLETKPSITDSRAAILLVGDIERV